MTSPQKRQIKELVACLRQAGYECTDLPGGHIRVTGPGCGLVILPSSPSDTRSLKNQLSTLKRNGYQFTFKGKAFNRV